MLEQAALSPTSAAKPARPARPARPKTMIGVPVGVDGRRNSDPNVLPGQQSVLHVVCSMCVGCRMRAWFGKRSE